MGDPYLSGDTRTQEAVGRLRRMQNDPQLVLDAENFSVDQTPVSAIMTTSVVSFPTDTGLETATRMMLERGISGAPVTDDNGRPVGMVSKSDLLEAWQQYLAGEDDVVIAEHPRRRAVDLMDAGPDMEVEDASGIVVGDIMVPYLLAVSQHAPIALAAALMAYEGVHRLLVLDDNNEMAGIMSALDVLRWLAQLTGFCLPRYTQRQRNG